MNCMTDKVPNVLRSLLATTMMKALHNPIQVADLGYRNCSASQAGVLIINADDWGLDRTNTERILECSQRGTVSSVSAMVFMEDSERAAEVALERAISAGLHLNFTTPFSAPSCSVRLADRQRELTAFLRSNRFGRAIFHPGLVRSFDYVVAAQIEEFHRLYQQAPNRLDGHHHMHLCANALFGKLLPAGTIVRRNENFLASEKGPINRLYRKAVDRILVRRHRMVDYFFTLAPIRPPGRLQRIFSLSREFVVELETHPVDPEEYRLLTSEDIFSYIENLQIARKFDLA
ncbi:MAG TPA: ChbG/HpnK family deacetylase [Candidatus Acidoferrum sp.]|nr:ChbG/HpnK family deacetylase [Candidatus Acidoferrum sp.]